METPTTPEAVAQTPQTSPTPNATPTQQQAPDAVVRPPETSTLSSTPPESDTRPDPSRPTIDLPATASLDEIIAVIPADVIAGLSSEDMNALAKGDPKAVARVLNQPLQATPITKPAEQVAPETTQAAPESDDDKGINRISLRGLSTKDQRSVANAVQAVKEGKFGSLDEALIELAKTAPAVEATETPATSPQVEVSPRITEIEQKIADAKAKQQEAVDSFNTAEVLKLSDEITDLKLELRDEKEKDKQAQSANQSWASQELQHIASVEGQLADPVFAQEFADARILAEHKKDPIFDSPDWSVKLAERVKAKLTGAAPARPGQPAVQTPFPTPPAREVQVRGALETPSGQGVPSMSVNEALAEMDNMSEEQIDATLHAIRAKEAAARLHR